MAGGISSTHPLPRASPTTPNLDENKHNQNPSKSYVLIRASMQHDDATQYSPTYVYTLYTTEESISSTSLAYAELLGGVGGSENQPHLTLELFDESVKVS